MRQSASWAPYAGSGAIILAVVLFILAGVLVYAAIRLPRPITFKRPGKTFGALIVVMFVIALVAFLVAVTVYVQALIQQIGSIPTPPNPISPVTMASALVTFFVIIALARHSGLWGAIGSAIVGTIAAPMIFELPFDLIVMWRTYPPKPAAEYTLLYFLPLFLIELLSFAMVLLSPLVTVSRSTLFLLAGMFFIFAVWALVGFTYPASPVPTALNMLSKVLAFAAAASLFLPEGKLSRVTSIVETSEAENVTPIHATPSSGLL
ncbi:MAG TPA: hypothetical protein VFN78_10500 [Ktedonobacterales bacterium]|nr:hypothetical protein [Ktedonobacterales bacterium]